MTFKKLFVRFLINKNQKKLNLWKNKSVENQDFWFKKLINSGKNTLFGKDHDFVNINSYEDFKKFVPIRDYEGIKNYIEKIKKGDSNILWKGKPIYFAKTSGTTSGTKYIPITNESMPFHIEGAKNSLFNYVYLSNNYKIFEGKMIFIQGNPKLEKIKGINIGRLSGIVAHYVPKYLQKNRLPTWETNNIDDWEEKIDKIILETEKENMTVFGGIPPWLLMYFERLKQKTDEKISSIFPNFDLMITGGVNYNPYKDIMDNILGKSITTIQTFPASEGFFAFQDQLNDEALLLMTNHGIFYEFIALEEYENEYQNRITIKDVELNKDYVLIISTNAGLWAYDIGDTVRFVSKNPFRILVSGRTKHFTSAFGEHVIAYEVEKALQETQSKFNLRIKEFTLAPKINTEEKDLPYHEWFIEFEQIPSNLDIISLYLDNKMCELNTYYNDLISGKVLQPLKIRIIKPNGFHLMMDKIGKLGGQNKIPRLTNNRVFADLLDEYILN